MRRAVCLTLALLLAAGALAAPGYAAGEPEQSEGQQTVTAESQEGAGDTAPGTPDIQEPETGQEGGGTDVTEPPASPSPEPPATSAPEPTATPVPTPVPTMVPELPDNGQTRLQIDDVNVYEGMDRAYKDGYVPQVKDGVLTLVMPLLASHEVMGGQITVTPSLGDAGSSPVQVKNYQKTFYLADNPVNATGEPGEVLQTVPSYLVRFDFPLKAERQNGTYPINLEVKGVGSDGTVLSQVFVCYVTIADVPAPKEDTAAPVYVGGGGGMVQEDPESKPRVLVDRYTVNKAPVKAGESFAVKVTLRNTSQTQDVQNMLVTVTGESQHLVLQNATSTIFMGDLAAGETTELELKYKTDLETPAQRYAVNLAMEYDDSDAVTMSSSGTVSVEVVQAVDVELGPFTIPSEVNAGDTIQQSFQVMNLGRGPIYNVRVELDVPGLFPSGTAFIGNMEPGTSATASMSVFAGMKEGESERYGYTYGKVRLIYEDAGGKEYVDETGTSTNVKELVIASAKEQEQEQQAQAEEQARTVQWWVFVAGGGVVIALAAGIVALRRKPTGSYRHVKR